MEELTSWIFSLEAVDLAMQLRSTTLSDLCINCELERFAKKLLSPERCDLQICFKYLKFNVL